MAIAQDRKKRKLLEELQQMPIVQVACKRVGIPRSTYYRWRTEDEAFATQATEALSHGIEVVNDVAESKVISGVNSGEQKYVIYWLNNRHPAYNLQRAPHLPSDYEQLLSAEQRQYEQIDELIRKITSDPANLPDQLPDANSRDEN